MPQATKELRDRWHCDSCAFEQLGKRFKVSRGGIISPKYMVVPKEADLSAINYLCQEWDYGYQPREAA